VGRRSRRGQRVEALDMQSTMVTDPQIICNSLNEHFLNIGMSSKSVQLEPTYTCLGSPLFVQFPLIELGELEASVNQLRNKCIPQDVLSPQLLKTCFPEIGPNLLHLLNLSLRTDKIPAALKHSVLCPVLKKGDPKNPSNYRPIAMLKAVAKILEKLVKARLLNHLNSIIFFITFSTGIGRG